MENQKMEKSQNSLARLGNVVEELVAVVQNERADFARQMAENQAQLQNAMNKVSILEAQVQSLQNEKEAMQTSLAEASQYAGMEEKMTELQNVVEARNTKISGLQTEVQNLNTALSNRKNQIETLEGEKNELLTRLNEANAKISALEDTGAEHSSAVAEIQNRLDEELKIKEDLTQKYQASEQKVAEMEEKISQTAENIDEVVARLEKVLEENGTGNSHN